MEKFIRLLNIERFRGLLHGKRLPEPERKIIERLLAEEEAKDTKKTKSNSARTLQRSRA